MTAGHVAEFVTGQRWEDLVQRRILTPLGMDSTAFARPAASRATLSYHENSARELLLNKPLAVEVLAPAGGSIYSTVEDMARWMLFNLSAGNALGNALVKSQTLAEILAPQIAGGSDSTCPTPGSAYAMGWFVDSYNGRLRVSHTGYLHDVNSEVMLFPQDDIGIACFTNFGGPRLARVVGQYAFDLIKDFKPERTVEAHLAQYETNIADTRARIAATPRVERTAPSHALDDYAGAYQHPGYGKIQIHRTGQELVFQRGNLSLPLQHWHDDLWIAASSETVPVEMFPIHERHAFDRASHLAFDTDADGAIAAVSLRLEPAVAAIRFARQPTRE